MVRHPVKMERPERMPAGYSMTARGPSDTPGRRPIPNSAATSNAPMPPPIPNLRKILSNSSLLVSSAMPASQVIALAREAMRDAVQTESQTAEANGIGMPPKTGVTVDLSRKHIQKLPDEVIDIVKDELERLDHQVVYFLVGNTR